MMKKLLSFDIFTAFKDWYIQMMLFLTLIANLGIWIIIYTRVEASEDVIPLHYNIYFGISYVGEWYRIFTLPVLGLIVGVINILLSNVFYIKDKFLSYIVMTTTFAIQGILLFSIHLLTSYII